LEYWLAHIVAVGIVKAFNELKEILKEGKEK
jgi:hypothetical protein